MIRCSPLWSAAAEGRTDQAIELTARAINSVRTMIAGNSCSATKPLNPIHQLMLPMAMEWEWSRSAGEALLCAMEITQ